MDIVIVGDGKVGFALSDQLNKEGHNITIIDNNLHTLGQTTELLDVIGVHGNGATRQIQLEAGVEDADLLIAVTSSDELNMLCCLLAKALGAQNTIARIRNPEYMAQLHMLQEQLGLSLAINPELATAHAIARVLKFPPAAKVDTLAGGRVELIEFVLPEDSVGVGKRLMDLPFKSGAKILICAVERAGGVEIPGGAFTLRQGDKLHITGESHAITDFLAAIGGINFRVRTVMIVGGGKLSYYLAKNLDSRRFQIKIVEKEEKRCDALCEMLPKSTIIHGDGSDIELLESEGLDDVDAFVALTGMDEENLIMSMIASNKKVPKVVTKVNRLDYYSIIEKMGLHTVVSPKMITADEITQFVRAMQNTLSSPMNALYRLVGGKAEAAEFTVGEWTRHLGKTLLELPIRSNMLLGVIVRGGRVIIPKGDDHIEEGDTVMVITSGHRLSDLNDIFEE